MSGRTIFGGTRCPVTPVNLLFLTVLTFEVPFSRGVVTGNLVRDNFGPDLNYRLVRTDLFFFFFFFFWVCATVAVQTCPHTGINHYNKEL